MELLNRFKAGDIEAFETLFRQFQAEVYRWIVRIVRDHCVAEDLTIETFWRIYRTRRHFDSERSFAAWARRIATNVSIDHLRRQHHYQELPDNLPAVQQADTVFSREIRENVERAFQRERDQTIVEGHDSPGEPRTLA